MLGINGKQWNDIQWTDVEEFLNEIEESFFFEFKKDEVSGAKLIKEITALANTYGGYVFLGVSDDKKIEGCQKWDEQRIHATICLLYTSPSPRDVEESRMPSSA